MPISRPLRFGVLGTSRIADSQHAPALRSSKRATLHAIASRDPEKASAFAARHGVPVVHARYEELLADDSIDAVLVPLPNALHTPWTLRAVTAGRHVLVEKPLALDPTAVDAIAAAATEPGVVVMEAFTHRFTPALQLARDLVSSGEYGAPLEASCRLTYLLGDWTTDVRARADLGGGALWDCGCYTVSALRFVLGEEPIRVTARQIIREPNGVDSTFEGTLHFSSGAEGNIVASMEQPFQAVLDIRCETGRIVVPQLFAGHTLKTTDGSGREEQRTLPTVNRFQLQIDHFCDAVQGIAPLAFPLPDARANAEALLALKSAAESGRATPLPRPSITA